MRSNTPETLLHDTMVLESTRTVLRHLSNYYMERDTRERGEKRMKRKKGERTKRPAQVSLIRVFNNGIHGKRSIRSVCLCRWYKPYVCWGRNLNPLPPSETLLHNRYYLNPDKVIEVNVIKNLILVLRRYLPYDSL